MHSPVPPRLIVTVGNALRAAIAGMGAEAMVPSNRCRKVAIRHDTIAYKHRNHIERCFSNLRHCRRFATRYDRRSIHFADAMIWLR